MANLFKDIPGVVTFLDDVLIATREDSIERHLLTLHKVLSRLKEHGLKLKKEKCSFFVNKVKYLGYIIDKDGIHADPDEVTPILNMAIPRDISELRSFIGMVNFYSRFIKNLSMDLHPLYYLLKKDILWEWGKRQQYAFDKVKRRLSETAALCHYEPEAALIVTCDASARGLGAVLAQRTADGERPVMFASRALTPAELNYSQIQKEALAIVFAVKKFHQYLYGRPFKLRTDHKPLVTIFGPQHGIPSMTASRLQRWALILTAYDFDIEYVRSSENVADALSRMIMTYKEIGSGDGQECPEQTYLHFASEALLLDYNQLKIETARDSTLSRVLSYLKDGWPSEVEIKELKPFFNRRHELYEELGCIMWGHRVVIPKACTERVLNELHDAHMGINKSKQLARSYVWWPGVDEAVEAVCRACEVCASVADAPERHTPRSWPWPERPWTRLHLDFLGPLEGATYLVTVDSYSKWIEISKVSSTSANCVIGILRTMWARFGIPKKIVSDNGPPFSSAEFASFLKYNGVEHVFSSPYHPASNGAAENAVRICKRVIKKANIQRLDVITALNRYLLIYRNTEHCTTGESPAKLLQGRSLRTRLDVLKPERGERVRREQLRQESAAGGTIRSFEPGSCIWYRNYKKGTAIWLKGKIDKRLGQTDYNIITTDNSIIHRHVDQIRSRSVTLTDTSSTSKGDAKRSYLIYPGDIVATADGEVTSSDRSPRHELGARAGGGADAATSPQAGPALASDPSVSEIPSRRPHRNRTPTRRYGIEFD
ncbi:uncharacterized protein K02A2.6-like [Achroia grisella]|uniref:uncharacterized protein K02A2.6-like n=1 Tax=Achroia grisella TaxID=688607 RepID=UPI0027D34C09|nr:uncharacterized protein K02A2.6-like [Achroia grisella]